MQLPSGWPDAELQGYVGPDLTLSGCLTVSIPQLYVVVALDYAARTLDDIR